VVSCIAVAPLARVILDLQRTRRIEVSLFVAGLAILALIFSISWARMKRFRELSEKPVFHAFLAQSETGSAAAAGNTQK
jgi:hypothetical protein